MCQERAQGYPPSWLRAMSQVERAVVPGRRTEDVDTDREESSLQRELKTWTSGSHLGRLCI
jgi:hypothetical protein